MVKKKIPESDVELSRLLQELQGREVSALDFLPEGSLAEKMIALDLGGPPSHAPVRLSGLFNNLAQQLGAVDTSQCSVVVFGGGTGLSNVIGGDSRRPAWREHPFTGLKECFPNINSIVCITDDGGSTGELLKDLPLIALGDLRHVFLSSIRKENLKKIYELDDEGALQTARWLHDVFNYRFQAKPTSIKQLLRASGAGSVGVPEKLVHFVQQLGALLFSDSRLAVTLRRPQCLGNLLVASAIYAQLDPTLTNEDLHTEMTAVHDAVILGLSELAVQLGADSHCVLPCTTTMARLQVLYGNGVLVTSERKSGDARRGYPVERVFVEFFAEPLMSAEVARLVAEADIIIFAPGSLYTSIIPILQAPGLAEAVKNNSKALKLLVSNIWVQKGETDAAFEAPNRKFHVSDMIRAYHRNIPGGVRNLFSHVLTLGLGEIPGSVLQNYALEAKEPIYLDRDRVFELGFETVEACIFSEDMLYRHKIVQHDPGALARAIRTLWGLQARGLFGRANQLEGVLPDPEWFPIVVNGKTPLPCKRYHAICAKLTSLRTDYFGEGDSGAVIMASAERKSLLSTLAEIIWSHPDILLNHLDYIEGITLVEAGSWKRCQEWDNVFSFFDPADGKIKIRHDMVAHPGRFEVAFLVALGQSLLGNYALKKEMEEFASNGEQVGRIFCLTLRDPRQCKAFFSHDELDGYLKLARMRRSENNARVYTRLINHSEGFTPPGLLFGLLYAWYLDNRFATHIEYKMSIMRNEISNLVPEQVRIVGRREGLIAFFREAVFRHFYPSCELSARC